VLGNGLLDRLGLSRRIPVLRPRLFDFDAELSCGIVEARIGCIPVRMAKYASREDILEGLRKSLPHEVALQNAPDTDGTFFKVPKVIER